MAIAISTDRPKSVCNRCVIEVFCQFVFLDFSVGVRAFVIELSQTSSFFCCFLERCYNVLSVKKFLENGTSCSDDDQQFLL